MVPKATFDGEYFESKAIIGDNFVGHPFCEDHMPDKTDERYAFCAHESVCVCITTLMLCFERTIRLMRFF